MAVTGFEGVEAGGDADVAGGVVDAEAEAGNGEVFTEGDCRG